MNKRLESLKAEKHTLLAEQRKLLDAADAQTRDLTEDESKKYQAQDDRLIVLNRSIEREEKLAAEELVMAAAYRPTEQASIVTVKDSWLDDPKRGFKSTTEFLTSLIDTAAKGRVDDNRLKFLATAGSDEQSTFADPYGGFLIPSGFTPNLLSLAAEVDPVAGRVTQIPMATPTVEIPARTDKTHTNSVSGGLRVYWRAEADTVTAARMEFEKVTLNAHMLFGLTYATEELLEQSPISFVAILEAGFRDEFASKMMDTRITGTGVGCMEGILTTPALISVSKETGQAADTIVYENVLKMRARCWRYSNAIWLANHDCLPQLQVMYLAVGAGGVPVWQPSAREGEPDMLLGRPIYFTEFCDTVGDKGDILLGDWSQYLEGTLAPLRSAESIHVRFVNHERTFKFWLQRDGKCWWRSALTPKNGAATLSPFVALDARA